MLGLPWQRREERESTEKAYALLDRVGLAVPRQRAGGLARLRRAAAAGDRAGAGHRPRRHPARRAGGRHQPGREARARGADQAGQRRRHRRAAHRARHEAGDVGGRTGSWCSTSARRSPRAPPSRSSATRSSSPPTSAPRPRRREAELATHHQPELHAIDTSRRRLGAEPHEPGAEPDHGQARGMTVPHRRRVRSRRGSSATSCSTSGTSVVKLRRHRGDQGHLVRRARGRDRGAARSERCRQDHDAEDGLGHAAAGRGLDHLRRPADRRHPAARADHPRGLPRARGPARVPADVASRRTSRWARSASASPTRHCWSRCSDLFPRLKERFRQQAGHPLRRRAADARHRPGADGQAAAAAARRAVDGARPADRRADLRDRP